MSHIKVIRILLNFRLYLKKGRSSQQKGALKTCDAFGRLIWDVPIQSLMTRKTTGLPSYDNLQQVINKLLEILFLQV